MSLTVPLWAWILLASLLVAFLAIDLLAHRGHHGESRRAALAWSAAWIAAALGFGAFVAIYFGADAGEAYLGAYLLEKSLSIDNLFVFLLVFAALRIPRAEQRRVLTWGIVGALVSRALFIGLGAALLHRWHAVTYAFGALLLVAAAKTLRPPSHDPTAEPPRLLRWAQRLGASPILTAIIVIELTDIVFALDSIPAAFAVTDEPYLVYSSNVFAILGLRALYIVLADALARLRYLHYGLAAVLGFAGAKLLLAPWVSISPLLSVAIIGACIGAAAVASLARRR